MTDLHTAAKTLERVLAEAKKSERHQTFAETRYWCDQYKQIANEAIRHFRQALANEALDRMAENAREVGLDYEPATKAGVLGAMKDELWKQPAQQEPVGYWQGEFSKDGGATLYEVPQESMFGRKYRNIPLYDRPQAREWVGLTDEEIDKLPWGPHEGNPMTFAEGLRDFARAIEAAHGITGEKK